jgi:lysophospholipase L1-like esterase
VNVKDIDREKYSFIEGDNANFQYTGRVDFENIKIPTLVYAGSYIRTKFEGTSVSICIKDYHESYESAIGYIIDDEIEGKIVITDYEEELVLNVKEGLENKVHDLVIFKRVDSSHYFDFYGLVLDKGCTLVYPGDKPKRKIECFGDSISAGQVCEALDYVGKEDPEHNGEFSNSWYSYSMMIARNLNAEFNNNAQGGISLFNNTGYFVNGTIGLEQTYDKLRYNPQLGVYTPWDFSRFTPNVVIMAIGQNDAYPENYINTDMERRKKWKEKYKEIMRDLRGKYPDALFIIITTILGHDKGWDEALNEVRDELDDEKVVRYLFKRNGCGTPGHVRIPEAKEMANELTSFIESFGEGIWE